MTPHALAPFVELSLSFGSVRFDRVQIHGGGRNIS
jgi:hypothetical protein